MQNDFKDEDFISEFKVIFPHLWSEILEQYSFWKTKNDVLLKHGKKSRYDFPPPDKFILTNSYHIRKKMQPYINQQEAKRLVDRNNLIQIGVDKLDSMEKRKAKKLELTQEIEPEFLEKAINEYFNLKGSPQEIINKKLEIIREVGNYKSDRSSGFLQKINAKENNFELKQVAMKMLQNMNEKVLLRRKKQGKQSAYVNAEPTTADSPDSLFDKLFKQMHHFESSKAFDVFLSHSSLDREVIIQFYKKLNLLKLHVYIDWVNDKHPLQRNLTNENTAKSILQRLRKSKVLICYISEASIKSQWTPWEVGYFDGLGKPVFIYNPDNIDLPPFLKIYPSSELTNDLLFVEHENQPLKLDELIKGLTS